MPLPTDNDVSVIMRRKLYRRCVRSCMLHDSETWPVKKENELTLQRAEMIMIRWMCGVKVRFTCSELRERLGIDDIITVVQKEVKMVWACFK